MNTKKQEFTEKMYNKSPVGYTRDEINKIDINFNQNKIPNKNNQKNFFNQKQEIENLNKFLPTFIIKDLNKESNEEIPTNKNNFHSQKFFFEDEDETDEKNKDNQRLIINTIKNLDGLVDSNNFDEINFNNLNLEVKLFQLLNIFL